MGHVLSLITSHFRPQTGTVVVVVTFVFYLNVSIKIICITEKETVRASIFSPQSTPRHGTSQAPPPCPRSDQSFTGSEQLQES